MSEKLGKLHFWLMFIGFNLTFAPMHWLGLQGMVRRTWKYAPETGLEPWNLVVSVGAFIIALSIAIFMYNWWASKRKGEPSGLDPWDARTLEWTIPNPTPEYNFAVAPVVNGLDDFWHQKYGSDEEGRAVRRPEADALIAHYEDVGLNPPVPIHLPAPSYFPIVMAAGLPIVFYGVIYHNSVVGKLAIALGALISLSALIGWGMEPLEEATEGPHEEAYEEPQAMVEEPGGEVEE
jgi:cytochrome c oxidase subunit 1